MADNGIEQKLLGFKRQIEQARTTKAQAEGRLQGIDERLAKDHNCKSPEEAERKAARLEKEAERLEREVEDGLAEIQEKWGLG